MRDPVRDFPVAAGDRLSVSVRGPVHEVKKATSDLGPRTSDDAAKPSSSRRGYIDYLRGLAILIMIEAHVTDSWTSVADRAGVVFGHLRILSGFAAPMFLFLAGLSVVLAADARFRKTGDLPAASRAVQRRGWEIFALAFVFRFQSFILNPRALPVQMLRVDILNIMGPGIVLAALLWRASRTTRGRLVAFGIAALATSVLSAWVRQTPLIAWLPDPILNYFKPLPGRDTFNLFPWVAFVFAGGFVGAIVDGVRDARNDVRAHAALTAGGALLAIGAYLASFLPSPVPGTQFWTTSPAFFLLRVGIIVMVLGVVFFQHRLPALTPLARLRPMQQFGRSSLIVYWIHVEIVYGAVTHALQKELTIGQALVGVAVVAVAMYAFVLVKDDVKARWRAAKQAKSDGVAAATA